jgi:hypothetical protein
MPGPGKEEKRNVRAAPRRYVPHSNYCFRGSYPHILRRWDIAACVGSVLSAIHTHISCIISQSPSLSILTCAQSLQPSRDVRNPKRTNLSQSTKDWSTPAIALTHTNAPSHRSLHQPRHQPSNTIDTNHGLDGNACLPGLPYFETQAQQGKITVERVAVRRDKTAQGGSVKRI